MKITTITKIKCLSCGYIFMFTKPQLTSMKSLTIKLSSAQSGGELLNRADPEIVSIACPKCRSKGSFCPKCKTFNITRSYGCTKACQCGTLINRKEKN